MHIISKKKLREYYKDNVQSKLPLIEWYEKMKICKAKNIDELRTIFKSADPVYGYTVFNIGGNNYRLITDIHYNRKKCYIRKIWTHSEYDQAVNRDRLRRGRL